ncbi:MAG: tetratricopeptide repeat protein [Polyangiaceae bacterium]|nr:tetratricopeptide repeat protein [Polyangiaceae bacterium]
MHRAVVIFLALTSLTAAAPAFAETPPVENWATARARTLTEQGEAHAAAGSTQQAVARFNEAIAIDSTFERAYLGLASLRASLGEYDEALVVLDMGLERVHGFDAALALKADVLVRSKRFTDATGVYLHALAAKPDDEALLARVVQTAARAGLFPVALGAARRTLQLARSRGDVAAEKDAKITVIALQNLVADADPVLSGRRGKDPVRRALARAISLR